MTSRKVWKRFIGYAFASIRGGTSPLTVHDTENLGREIFSKRLFARTTERVKPPAFMPPNGGRKISVTRIGLIERKIAIEIARKHGEGRRQTFYGFGEIIARAVSQADARTSGCPTFDNPFHANIVIPKDVRKDAVLDTARKLAERATFRDP